MPDRPYDDINDIYDRLHGDARTNPVPEHVMDVTTTEGLTEARKLVNYAIHREWTSVPKLVKRSGYKSGVIYDFLGDKWGKRKAGLQPTVASKLAKIINQIMRENQAKETEVGGFVTTRLAEAIYAIIQYAIKRHKIAVFVVPAGSGKTVALEAAEIEIPGAILLTVTQRRGTVKSFLQLWARKLQISQAGRAEDIQDRVVEKLTGSNRLVLIDEAHKLTVPTLDTIREIWDSTQIPIVMAATPILQQMITHQRVGTQAVELMDQFYSRVGVFRDLTKIENPKTGQEEPLVSLADVRRVFVRGHVRLAPDAEHYLCRLANTPGAGGLRVCRDLVQMIVDLWPGEAITEKQLRRACATRLGVKAAAQDPHGMDLHERTTMTAG